MAKIDELQAAAESGSIVEAVKLACDFNQVQLQESAFEELNAFDVVWAGMVIEERLAWLSGFVSGAQAKQMVGDDIVSVIEREIEDRAIDAANDLGDLDGG